MLGRILIANRGEIAVRIARTARRLGVETVAVYSEPDAGAPHVRAADLAVAIGPAAPARSYLDVERVVDAALRSGADAIHPGYGFLSERPELARACVEAGLVFVGPPAAAIELMGDKGAAREAAAAAGVPVLPGLGAGRGAVAPSDAEIEAWAAAEAGPVLLKAVAGGGGKGMRVVRDRTELAEALVATRRVAAGAFGDDRLMVERYVERSRHIEVQVIADGQGGAIHLGERECSLQRRHQKVVEESPSPVVGPALRERMGAAAVSLAERAAYVNAGTVELIAERDDPARFYFLEMNTRLQVEHPVTEAVTGLDLVELQLRVAAGEPLPLAQGDVGFEGHAVEARIYAEDPACGFLPSSGRIVAYREPAWVRVDSGVEAGFEVGTEYDPMLAKVVAHGNDRAAALAALRAALRELVLLGPATNVAFLHRLLGRPDVAAGEFDTGTVEAALVDGGLPGADPALAAAALATALADADDGDPWRAGDAWRPAGPTWTRARAGAPGAELEVAVRRGERGWSWRGDGGEGELELGAGIVTVEGVARPVATHRDGDAVWLDDGIGEPVRYAAEDRALGRAERPGGGSLEAPMPGTVIEVRCAPGDAVEAGQVLLVVESMKMELAMHSVAAGTVAAVEVAVGDRVERGQVLARVEGEGEEA